MEVMSKQTATEPILSVRRIQLEDIPPIVNYWTSASDAHLERMGSDKTKLPNATQFQTDLQHIYDTPDQEAKTFYSIWLVNNQAIGFSSLKNIAYGESGEMHLHIWNGDFRGKGYGPRLFCLSVLDFYKRFKLKKLKCEPRASNPLPNRMLQKIGFPLIDSFVGASSEISLVVELNRYDLPIGIAERYLANVRPPVIQE
ncbi:GNAT family N-acetyltransferase [Glaciimonas soli]|uniref:GNAT family N-acetyltransferase n=1 Tax=Glaciimonas soli TaxID=2590999 RepID=A0A843YZ71_9BURK|nr:GNAT family N-acetyltransferase [Glaciimonas soli]MQR02591.1 GNAT family N-acetyltransferase [Glaciimonas soli]